MWITKYGITKYGFVIQDSRVQVNWLSGDRKKDTS